jgi:raffinose/stachyose/melibiose transport system permease protein
LSELAIKEDELGLKKVMASSKKKKSELIVLYIMLFPNLLLFAVLSVYPVFWALRYMFYDYDGYNLVTFSGLDNFTRLFTKDPQFWHAVGNTFIYGGWKIVAIIPLAFIIALLLNGKRKGNATLQAIIFTPTILSSAVVAMVFYLLLNVYNGEVNRFLIYVHLIKQPISWLGESMAMVSVIILSVWGGVGNYMVYFLAGLQQVPNELYESGEIDGTTSFQRLIYITLPMLAPILKIIMMLAIIAAFQDYQSIMVLTQGGPFEATNVMFLYIFKLYYPINNVGDPSGGFNPQYGYGAAAAVIAAIICGAVTMLYLYLSKKLDDIF